MRVVLPFKLVGQKLVKGRDFPKSVADGSRDSIVIKVGGIPEGCVAKGYFKLSWESNTTYDLTFDGDELVVDEYIVTLPSHANNKYIDYKFSFSVAIWEGDVERLTTNPVEIVVEKSNYTDETTNTPDIPESQYDKLAQSVADVVDLTNSINEDVADHGRRIAVIEKGGKGLTKAQIGAIYGLLKIAAYTEDATAAHQAFLDAFAEPECQHEYDNACDPTCNLCGAVRATAHTYGEGIVTKEPDYGVDGVMTYTCTICGATKTEVIPALVQPVITAVYSPKTPKECVVNFAYDTDDAGSIRDWLTVTDEAGNIITDYTLADGADGNVVVSYNGATTTVDVDRNRMTIVSSDFYSGSSAAAYTSNAAGGPYTRFSDYYKIIYPPFIKAKAGYQYTFEVKLSESTDSAMPKIGLEFYNKLVADKVAARLEYPSGNAEDPGWQTLTNGVYSYTPSATYKDYPLSTFRFIFNASDGKIFTPGEIETVTITATPVTT